MNAIRAWTICLVIVVAVAVTVDGFVDWDLTFWNGDIQLNIDLMAENAYNPYREFNSLINSIFFKLSGLEFLSRLVIEAFGVENGYFAECYLRDLVAGTAVYWIAAGLWDLVIYRILGERLFTSKGRSLPSKEVIIDQMCLAQAAIFMYAGLPVLSEYIIEKGYTKCYFYLDQVGGWKMYFLYLFLYIAFVEVGIYWVHRTLHTNKFCYKYIHGLHHKYNTAATLTPWASIAFNPIDGLMQASPYLIGLFFLPVHYFTHIGLLFFSGIWATNIHDTVVRLCTVT